MTPALKKKLQQALPITKKASLEAGQFIMRKFGKIKHLDEKPDAGLVTEADKGAEKLILRALKKRFPTDHFVGEESGSSGHTGSPFRWHIDPLDGTTNFVHGFPMFCVSIGLEFEASELVLGVIHNPNTGDLYSAIRGGGAHRNGKRLRVSEINQVSNSLLSTGFSYRKDLYLASEIQTFERVSKVSRAVRRTGSAALDLTYVATGQFDGFWERGLSTWDVAAALTLLSEAGGKFTRLDGQPYRMGDDNLLATNTKLHAELFSLL